VSRQALIWSILAGAMAIGALSGYWIVLSDLIKMPANPLLPGNFAFSRSFIVAITIGASLVAPITEESAVRGYLQTVLERDFRPFTAVAVSSLVFALAHITQGVF
jgi:membrane protease YdiL (CAAX protease family)